MKKSLLKQYLYIYIYVLALLFFCAGSSPLNNYVSTDPSVFYTIGRSMCNGLIPYVDIIDHKGLYLYFLNYLVAFLFKESQIGIFFLEIVFSSFVGVVVFSIITNYLSSRKSFIATCLFLMFYFNYFTYQGGNLIDNYTSFLLLLHFLLIIKYGIRWDICFITGIIVAFISQTRITNILPFCGLALTLLIIKNNKKTVSIAFGLCGLIVGLIPMIIYSLANLCFSEMLFYTITFNIVYSTKYNTPISIKIIRTLLNPNYFLFMVLGALSCYIVFKKLSREKCLTFVFDFLMAIFSISLSDHISGHYFQIIVPFSLPFIIYSFDLNIINSLAKKVKKLTMFASLLCLFLMTILVNMRYPITLYFNSDSKSYVKHAEQLDFYIRNKYVQQPTVLITGNNALYYNKLNLLPHIRHFAAPSIPYSLYPLSDNEQANDILSIKNDIIVVFSSSDDIFEDNTLNQNVINTLNTNYTIIEKDDSLNLKIYEKVSKLNF